jgi:oligoendopeptidase F
MTTKKFYSVIILIILFSCSHINLFSQGSGELPAREQVDIKLTWNLADIYATSDAWDSDFIWIDSNIIKYKEFEGKLGNSATDLLNALKFDESMSIKLGKLYLYAYCYKDLDLSNSSYLSRYDKISQLYTKVYTANSFYYPEMLTISAQRLDSFLSQSKELMVYKHQFNDMLRSKEHILTKDKEELLAMTSEITGVPENAYDVLTNGEFQYPIIKDPDGNDIQLSEGRFDAARYSTDSAYRRRAYKAYYIPYKNHRNTLATLLNGELKSHIFNAKARKYESTQNAALEGYNIPIPVYNNLIATVNQNLEPLHRWNRLRKKVLGYSELHPYDSYVTLFPNVNKEYKYDLSTEIVKQALNPLGNDYVTNLTTAFDNRWIDVVETKGKMSGAYSIGTYGAHPYVLLNWNNQLNDLFTLAHEMGHNMHSFYTEKTQPFQYATYSIFLAEVASTCNEALLLDYLIQNSKSKDEKLSLIEKYISNIAGTFFIQTMFAEYELLIHQKAENGESLSADDLSQLYVELVKKYSGPDVVVDKEEANGWSRIPHFYYNFYVYQYATSFVASQVLAQNIITEKQPAIDRYLNFLKAGSSDYPINILKQTGVDMTSPEPVLKTINKMNQLLDEMEELLKE